MAIEDMEQYQWKKGKSGNPQGRPKSMMTEILDDLKEDGAEEVSKQAIKEVYRTMLSLTEKQIVKLTNDKKKPMLYRIVGKAMLSKKGFEIIETMLDRANGKPTQTQDVNQNTNLLAQGINFIMPEPDEAIKQKFDSAVGDND